MTSAINPAYPVEGTPTTESVRDNFAAAKTEIEALQTDKQDTLISGSTIKTVAGKSVVGSGNVEITKEDVGLPNVDNTSDMNKPVSTAQAAAISAAQTAAIASANDYTDADLAAHVAAADPHPQYLQLTTAQIAASVLGVAGVDAGGSLIGPDGLPVDSYDGTRVLSASRSLTSADNEFTLVYAGAGDITLTVPSGLVTNFSVTVVQAGQGKVSTTAGAGVSFSNLGVTDGPNTFFTLQATATNTYSHQNPQQGAPVLSAGLPFILLSSWTFGANGALTLSVALPTAFPNAFAYFPANSITASNPAGWYYVTFSTTTAGQVFNNTYTSGTPAVPASPVAFSAAAGAVVAQVTVPVTAMNSTVVGGSLGRNGWIRAEALFQANNSANNKACSVFYGNGSLFTGNASGANIYVEVNHRIGNCGVTNRQMARAATYNSFTGAPNYTAVDSTANQAFSVAMTLSTPATGDYVIASGVGAFLNYGA